VVGRQEGLAGKIGCIRRKTGRLGQADRKERQAEQRGKQACNATVHRKMGMPANGRRQLIKGGRILAGSVTV
jgi:hypothetical protein